jgi:four helix bundle protein
LKVGHSVLREKSYAFAIEVVKLARKLQNEETEFVLSKQLLRSGTAIGALLAEAEFGQSKADFTHKLTLALKEANETRYWLNLLYDTNFLDRENHTALLAKCTELIRILVASIKTTKQV